MSSSEPKQTVGWLGTGRMGTAMAGRLVDAGVPLRVWNRTKSKLAVLVERGAEAVDSMADLGSCEAVFITVSSSDDLRAVTTGEHGLLAGPVRPAVLVDCSTVSAEVSADVRAAAAERGVQFLASPISGNPHVVGEGNACLVVSGPRSAFDQTLPYLEAIARSVTYVGPDEQSRLVKLCHNLYLGIMAQALAEVTSLAEKGGTGRAEFLEFLNGTVLASDWVRKRTENLVDLDWTPMFTTELLRKDFDLGLRAARELEVPMPIGAAVHQLIQVAIGEGHRTDDFLSLYAVQARGAGIDLGQS